MVTVGHSVEGGHPEGARTMTLLIVLFLGVIAVFCVYQMASHGAVVKGAVDNEIQARERLVTLVRYQLGRWVKEPDFLTPSELTPDQVREHMKGIGLETFEVCVLALKPELWFGRAHEWVMTNSKANSGMATQIVRATYTSYVKDALEEKLGGEQFRAMERRLRWYYRYFEEKMPAFKPSGEIDKWWQDIDWWYDEYLTEAKVLGIVYASKSIVESDNRHAPRYQWIRDQVEVCGVKDYDRICEEAKTKFPESWQM